MILPITERLTLDDALIFRIVHRANVAAILRDGLHCSSTVPAGGNFVQIGNPELIAKRKQRTVSCPPGGILPDYVPFYFTPLTPMLYNVKTGYNGISQRPLRDILILMSDLPKLQDLGVAFVFSDRHAYLKTAKFSNDLKDLSWIDWTALQTRNFKRDDPDRFERYQAEALIHRRMPVSALRGVACYDAAAQQEVEAIAAAANVTLKVAVRPGWYP